MLDIGPHGLNIGSLKEPVDVVVEIMRVDLLGLWLQRVYQSNVGT